MVLKIKTITFTVTRKQYNMTSDSNGISKFSQSNFYNKNQWNNLQGQNQQEMNCKSNYPRKNHPLRNSRNVKGKIKIKK